VTFCFIFPFLGLLHQKLDPNFGLIRVLKHFGPSHGSKIKVFGIFIWLSIMRNRMEQVSSKSELIQKSWRFKNGLHIQLRSVQNIFSRPPIFMKLNIVILHIKYFQKKLILERSFSLIFCLGPQKIFLAIEKIETFHTLCHRNYRNGFHEKWCLPKL
jgi:hypothetical protein